MNCVVDDPYRPFAQEVDAVVAERHAEVERLRCAITAKHHDEAEANEAIDDLLADIVSAVAATAANQVRDADADEVITAVEARFAEDVTNASIERRLAALLLRVDPVTIQREFLRAPTLA